MKYKYDLADEAKFAQFNIASGVDGDTVKSSFLISSYLCCCNCYCIQVTEGIPDPYADQSQRTEARSGAIFSVQIV